MTPKKGEMDFDEVVGLLTQKKTYTDFFTRTPCVKSSYVWGIACGAIMSAHKLRLYPGNLGRAGNSFFLTFMLVSSYSFMTCAQQTNQKYESVKYAMEHQGQFKEYSDLKKQQH